MSRAKSPLLIGLGLTKLPKMVGTSPYIPICSGGPISCAAAALECFTGLANDELWSWSP